MTQSEWLDGFTERLRNVLQKHDRELDPLHPRTIAENGTDAAIDELGRFLLDATQRSIHFEPPVISSPLHRVAPK